MSSGVTLDKYFKKINFYRKEIWFYFTGRVYHTELCGATGVSK